MARWEPGERNRVQQMIQGQIQQRMADFEGVKLQCPNMIKVVDVDGKEETQVCGSMLFERKEFLAVEYMPEIVSGQPGGATKFTPVYFLECILCGHLMPPTVWQPLVKEAYEHQAKVILPEKMKPEDNGEH